LKKKDSIRLAVSFIGVIKMEELEVTWGRVLKIWWSYVWRNLLAIIGAMVVGGLVGGIIGFVMGALGMSAEAIRMVVAPVSGAMGVAISIVPMKLILGKNFGEFRLVLLKT